VLEEAEKWRKGVFQVTREVYEKDEPLCSAIEQAIWVSVLPPLLYAVRSQMLIARPLSVQYEADKLVLAIRNVRDNLESQVTWLDAAEQEMNAVLRDMVTKRYVKELAAVNQLVERIEQRIEDAQPVPDYWLVSPDALAVDPATAWDDFSAYLPAHLRPRTALSVPIEETHGSATTSPRSLNSFKPCLTPQNKHMLNKVKKSLTAGTAKGFVPEHTAAAVDLEGAGKKKMEKQPVNSRVTHLRRPSTQPTSAESAADEQFRKEMAIFEAKRLVFEDKVLKRRAERERDFRLMGMSAVTAKLAAYNELLLDEQQDMQDFEAKFRPKRRPMSHLARRTSTATGGGARRPSSAVKSSADSANRRPTSANAAMH
jgi:hypothetical protein